MHFDVIFAGGCVKQQDERGETEESRRKLHFEPRKEFLLQDPVADWLVADSASVGVAGADPPKPRPLATLTTSTDGLIGSSAAESPPPLSGRTLPDAFTLLLPARTYTHTQPQTHDRVAKKNMPLCLVFRNQSNNKNKKKESHTGTTYTHTHTPIKCPLVFFCSRHGGGFQRETKRIPKFPSKKKDGSRI